MLLACGQAAQWASIRQISHREATHAAERCADPRGDAALRHQWARVERLIREQQAGKLSQKQAAAEFAESYKRALAEAGAPPDCPGGDG